jgi:hypothetical protein
LIQYSEMTNSTASAAPNRKRSGNHAQSGSVTRKARSDRTPIAMAAASSGRTPKRRAQPEMKGAQRIDANPDMEVLSPIIVPDAPLECSAKDRSGIDSDRPMPTVTMVAMAAPMDRTVLRSNIRDGDVSGGDVSSLGVSVMRPFCNVAPLRHGNCYCGR